MQNEPKVSRRKFLICLLLPKIDNRHITDRSKIKLRTRAFINIYGSGYNLIWVRTIGPQVLRASLRSATIDALGPSSSHALQNETGKWKRDWNWAVFFYFSLQTVRQPDWPQSKTSQSKTSLEKSKLVKTNVLNVLTNVDSWNIFPGIKMQLNCIPVIPVRYWVDLILYVQVLIKIIDIIVNEIRSAKNKTSIFL